MITTRKGIYYVASTRFNDDTWCENERYRNKYDFNGCIYGVPKLLAETIQKEAKVYIFEMNNTKPCKIMGIGIIQNKTRFDKQYNIYKDNNYNRYTYIGKKRVGRDMLNEAELEKLKVIENIVFKGKDHIKRGQGITCFPNKKIKSNYKDITEFIKIIDGKFQCNSENNTGTNIDICKSVTINQEDICVISSSL